MFQLVRRSLCMRCLCVLFFLILITAAVLCYNYYANRDALWNIISQQCLPHHAMGEGPAPCARVDEKQGIVVYKDRNGPLQHLLIPSIKITGIESPLLLPSATPNYFEQAWQARHFMSEKYGAPVPDSDIALTVNSPLGRTQYQLHIHISCLLPLVKNQLVNQRDTISNQWQSFGLLLGHHYQAKRVTAAQLHHEGAFRILAQGIQGTDQQMGHYGLAMAALGDGDFVLLATKRRLSDLNRASAEEIQDHSCKILPVPP